LKLRDSLAWLNFLRSYMENYYVNTPPPSGGLLAVQGTRDKNYAGDQQPMHVPSKTIA
jgi:hypothetical protein